MAAAQSRRLVEHVDRERVHDLRVESAASPLTHHLDGACRPVQESLEVGVSGDMHDPDHERQVRPGRAAQRPAPVPAFGQ
jgi:hypothetical protein